MKKTLGYLALVCGAAAAAPQINVQGRADYRYDMRSEAVDNQRDNNGFDLQYARLDVKGNANEDLNYRLRLRFDFASQSVSPDGKTAVVKDTLKGSAGYIDMLYAKQKLPMGFSVTAGKFFSGRCGWEGETSGMDLYQTTLVYAVTAGAYQTPLGVQPAWEGFGQNVSFLVANSGVKWGADPGEQHYLMVGGVWKGTFLKGAIQPNLSLIYMPVKHLGNGQYLANVGLRSNVGIFGGELEWKSFGDSTNAKGDMPFVQSYSALAKVDLGMFRPQVRFIYDNKSILDEKKSLEQVSVSPVLEIVPFPKSTFRWHVGYSMLDVIPKGSNDYIYNKVFAGMSMNLDVMK